MVLYQKRHLFYSSIEKFSHFVDEETIPIEIREKYKLKQSKVQEMKVSFDKTIKKIVNRQSDLAKKSHLERVKIWSRGWS